MNLTALDWGIVGFVYVFLVGGVLVTRKYMRSVADFLAAGRTAGRYRRIVPTVRYMLMYA